MRYASAHEELEPYVAQKDGEDITTAEVLAASSGKHSIEAIAGSCNREGERE